MHGFPELIRRRQHKDSWQINVISEENYGVMISAEISGQCEEMSETVSENVI